MTTTCLIGEADPFLARLLERFGVASGLTVVWAKVGQELLNLTHALRPDVIVVDPELPGTLRGWEALRAIGADSGLAHVRVLTCSWLRPTFPPRNSSTPSSSTSPMPSPCPCRGRPPCPA